MIVYGRYMYHPFMLDLCETENKVTKVRGYKLASVFSLEFVYIATLCKIVELRSGRALANQSRVHNDVILSRRCREGSLIHTALLSGNTDKPGGRG